MSDHKTMDGMHLVPVHLQHAVPARTAQLLYQYSFRSSMSVEYIPDLVKNLMQAMCECPVHGYQKRTVVTFAATQLVQFASHVSKVEKEEMLSSVEYWVEVMYHASKRPTRFTTDVVTATVSTAVKDEEDWVQHVRQVFPDTEWEDALLRQCVRTLFSFEAHMRYLGQITDALMSLLTMAYDVPGNTKRQLVMVLVKRYMARLKTVAVDAIATHAVDTLFDVAKNGIAIAAKVDKDGSVSLTCCMP